ncbi:MAG: hypothetical protein ISEC1_P1572 [Thiomicrorhabdus sp.]|nr:MAG: hypothetical protein ISEC1_P1572 [Thiomicrorhabdus sp.]
MNIQKHADNVVSGYKKTLTLEQLQLLGDESLEELQILIEAALGSAVSTALHDNVKEIEALAKETRKRAGSISLLEN